MRWILNDFTFCHPTKYLPRCTKCKRLDHPRNGLYSMADLYDECKDGKYAMFLKKDKK